MSRLERKKRTDILYKGCGGITDAFDDAIKGTWFIDDFEYDWICEHATDEELAFLYSELNTIQLKRDGLITIDDLLKRCENDE